MADTKGRVVGVIATYDNPEGTQGKPGAPLAVVWSLDRHRRDFNEAVDAGKPGSLSTYGQSLFDGCFKTW